MLLIVANIIAEHQKQIITSRECGVLISSVASVLFVDGLH